MDCSLPGSSAHGIFQARVLEWVAIDQDNLQMALRLKNEILYKTVKGHLGELFITLEYECGRFYYDSKFRSKRRGKEGRPNKQSMGKKSCYSYHGQRLNPLLYKKLLETEKKKINNAKEKNMKFNKPCLNTWEMQIKTTFIYHFSLKKLAKIQKFANTFCRQSCREIIYNHSRTLQNDTT